MSKKLSDSWRYNKFNSRPLTKEEEEKIKKASEMANAKIKTNVSIYESSATHAHLYPLR